MSNIHVLVDSAGVLIAAAVTPADVQDRNALPTLRKAKRVSPTIAHVWVDKGYTGTNLTRVAAKSGVTVDVVSGPKMRRGFLASHADGWSNAPTGASTTARRLDHHYEVTLHAHEGFLILSQIALLLRRLDPSQLFDTL